MTLEGAWTGMEQSGRRQPRRIPPPIDHGAEPIDSGVILREFPTDAGLLLWKTVRSLRLWSAAGVAERAEVFTAEAAERRDELLREGAFPASVTEALRTSAAVLGNGGRQAAELGAACRAVADWARGQERLGTALEFMQAAAFVEPERPETAWEVARLARHNGDFPRAESWYRQAISLARRGGKWEMFTRAYLGLGTVAMARGNYPAARRACLRGLRSAQRHSLRELAAMGHHDLAAVAIRTSREREVMRHTRAAIQAYGPRHPRLPALAHDIATFWVMQGYFRPAIRLYQLVRPTLITAQDRLKTTTMLVRAAAAAGEAEIYATAWREATRLLHNPAAAAGAAAAMVNMAHGAASTGDFDTAEEMARAGQRLAAQRSEAELQLEADALLGALASQRALARVREPDVRTPPAGVDELVDQLTASMFAGASA